MYSSTYIYPQERMYMCKLRAYGLYIPPFSTHYPTFTSTRYVTYGRRPTINLGRIIVGENRRTVKGERRISAVALRSTHSLMPAILSFMAIVTWSLCRIFFWI